MKEPDILFTLIESIDKSQLPANYLIWEEIEKMDGVANTISSSFFKAEKYPVTGFYKNISKSLPLDEINRKI